MRVDWLCTYTPLSLARRLFSLPNSYVLHQIEHSIGRQHHHDVATMCDPWHLSHSRGRGNDEHDGGDNLCYVARMSLEHGRVVVVSVLVCSGRVCVMMLVAFSRSVVTYRPSRKLSPVQCCTALGDESGVAVLHWAKCVEMKRERLRVMSVRVYVECDYSFFICLCHQQRRPHCICCIYCIYLPGNLFPVSTLIRYQLSLF